MGGQAYSSIILLALTTGCAVESTLIDHDPNATDTNTVPEEDTQAEADDTAEDIEKFDTGVVEDEEEIEVPAEQTTAIEATTEMIADDCSGYAYPTFTVVSPDWLLIAPGDEVELKIRLHSNCGAIKVHQLYFDLYYWWNYYSGSSNAWYYPVVESGLTSLLKIGTRSAPSAMPCPLSECPWAQPTYSWQDNSVAWPATHSPIQPIEIEVEGSQEFTFTWTASKFMGYGDTAVIHLHFWEWTDIATGTRLHANYTLDLTAGMTVQVEQ